MNRLNGRVAIVTGASRGIGAAIAKKLAREGAVVVVNYVKREQDAERIVQEIEAFGGEAEAVQADVAEPEQVRALIAGTVANFGRLDILVNNAAIYELLPLEEVTEVHYERLFNVNVRGPIFATQEAAKHLTEGGRIIHISSGAAEAGPAGASVYSATKAALNIMTKSIAAELGPRGITVNAVAPGFTESDMLFDHYPLERLEPIKGVTALRRIGKPEEIADVVAFLASEEGRWITGQIISANGGLGLV